jgi:hypothetical protein
MNADLDLAVVAARPPAARTRSRRFAVSWRNVHNKQRSPIGVLSSDGERYRFDYLSRAPHVEGLRPLFGFSDFHRAYSSDPLFPFFSQRIMDSRRPDYIDYLESLGLPNDASPLDVLGRSGGTRKADTFELTEEPRVERTGRTAHIFFVRGTRYAADDLGFSPRAIDRLEVGEQLQLKRESTNQVNPEAIQILSNEGTRIGWIPELLLDYVRTLEAIEEPRLEVVLVNGLTVPQYLDVLVKVSGQAPSGYRPFSGVDWQLASV